MLSTCLAVSEVGSVCLIVTLDSSHKRTVWQTEG